MAPMELTLACSVEMVVAGGQGTLLDADGLAFGGHFDGGFGSARRIDGDLDGEALAAEYLPGEC